MEPLKKNHFWSIIETSQKVMKNGRNYTIRANRSRFFFPDEWKLFYDNLRGKPKITFNLLLNTGARIMEIQNIKVSDLDLERGNIILRVTKKIINKKGMKEGKSNPRVVSISSECVKFLRKVIKEYNLTDTDNLPILSTQAGNQMLKRILKKIGVPDYSMFSLHNIRKTAEMYLLSLGIDSFKVTKRLGHSSAVAYKHYLSSEVFSFEEKREIHDILGDIKEKMTGGY